MTDEFKARASMRIEDVLDVFAPQQVGVGILERETAETPAILGIHLRGQFDADGPTVSLMVGLDTERAVGLIVQLRAMLLDAGVSPGQIITMMKEAFARMDAVRGQDRPPSFRCPVCFMVSYNPNDIANGYCGRCHGYTGEPS